MLDLQVTDPLDPEVFICESLNLNITMMIQVI